MHSAVKKYKLKSGAVRYRFTVYLGLDAFTGKPVSVSRAGFKTSKEADSKIAELKYKWSQGLLSGSTQDLKFSELVDSWLQLYVTTVKESTYQTTATRIKNHILPVFGDLFVSKITKSIIQEWAIGLSGYVKGREVFSLLKRIFTYAIKNLGIIKENPCSSVILPKFKTSKPKSEKELFLEKEALNRLLLACQDYGNYRFYVYVRLLAYTGMRRGECLALNRSDFDFNTSTVSITKTLTIGREFGQYLSSTPKTKKSYRTISLDHTTLSSVKKLISIQNEEGVIPVSGVLFLNKNGDYFSLSKPQKVLNRICKKYGLPKTTNHMLRHSHCSLLFDMGASIKEVQVRLGHEDISTTMEIYNHVTSKRKNNIASDFASYMSS